ncbi:pilin accessory protein (PilO) [Serratia fonticola]|uniref:Pilin accessory protein (PilO) n=1 Tax=Serratia fonticola TaxID=47917 RepID=A0A542CS65_SERFO|nr:type 4b pilus protein PilO2 [Serratia fonticola]TQI77274.1 pilin accessory protein (PilO) [Serratia fonticola]TQI93600.1 pilin accessory protein (PilO) [Serratia fonticola]TVZ61629.1 pilin accessory protein (PilO) [Serratia fonticola]
MKQQTTYTLQRGNIRFVAGLHWQYLPLRGRRNMRLRAKEAHATHWASLPTGDDQAQGTLLGTAIITDKATRKSGRLASMALAVLPALPEACYGVFPLPNGQYWFVAVSDGMLSPFGDIVGDEVTIRTAVSNFLDITPTPATPATPAANWSIYAPSGFFPDKEVDDKELYALIDNKIGLRRARLYQTHNPQALWLWSIAAVALAAGYVGYSVWETHQEEARIAVAQAALMARQQLEKQAPADNLKPWAIQPRFPPMLNACSHVWKDAQISIAGWVFNTATCDADGKITLHYTLPPGGTVGDFALRLPVLYGSDIQPVFNIPGSADDAAFSLPVLLSPPEKPETLLPGNQQIQHLTSYAQRINARLRLSEMDASTQLTQGNVQNLPWRTYSFTFITDIPPDRLFAPTRFNSSGIRASSITTTLKNNRLEYTIEGLLYANR